MGYMMWATTLLAGILLMSSPPAGALAPPLKSYNILMLLPVSSKSHRNVFMPLATALTERGHKITMLSNHPPQDQNPNIHYIEHGLPHFQPDKMNMFERQDDIFGFFRTVFPKIAKELYEVPDVMDLYKRRNEYDLMIINHMFNEAIYPFAHEQSYITIATGGLESSHSALLGNLLNPAYASNLLDNYPRPFSFINRVKNVFFSIVVPYNWRNAITNPTEVEIIKRFPHLPPLLEIERNQSLSLINTHFSLTKPMPLLPGQVEIGGMHCRPGKPLPKDLESFLSGSTPVVYFSLGSVARSSTIPAHHRRTILTTLAKLPYKVVWKFEEELKDLPKNVLIKKWLPQQDILAHPNVKMFITHGGLLSTQEAMYHATPMLLLPVFGDQPKNAKSITNSGLGKMILWDDLNEQIFTDSIAELIANPSYREKLSAVSAAFKDQPESPVERAVYWTEYVIRHNGATHLRSPERELSWIEVLHIDLILAVHFALFSVYYVLKKVFGFVCKALFPQKSGKKGKSKRE